MTKHRPPQEEHTRKKWRIGNIILVCLIAYLLLLAIISLSTLMFMKQKDFVPLLLLLTSTLGVLSAMAIMPYIAEKFADNAQELEYISNLVSEFEDEQTNSQEFHTETNDKPNSKFGGEHILGIVECGNAADTPRSNKTE